MPSRHARSAFDRRDSVRGPLCVLAEAGPGHLPLWAYDLGLGGMRCTARRAIWPGTYLDLRFAIPDTREEVTTGAQVVALEEDGPSVSLGLRFCALPEGSRLAIYRFLDRRRFLWAPMGMTTGLLSPSRLVRPPPAPPLDTLLAQVDAALAA